MPKAVQKHRGAREGPAERLRKLRPGVTVAQPDGPATLVRLLWTGFTGHCQRWVVRFRDVTTAARLIDAKGLTA